MRRGFGRRTRRSGGAYRGAAGLAIGALGIGALIVFLLQRARGDVREKVERASETAKSRAEEYMGTSRSGGNLRRPGERRRRERKRERC